MRQYLVKARNSFYADGALKTLNKIAKDGFYKHYRNHINYLMKHGKYPRNVIFIAGFPKSGTSWLANLFSSLDGFDRFTPSRWNLYQPEKWGVYSDLYPGFFDEFKYRLAVVKGHTWGKPSNVEILEASCLKYIITVRDPRDKIISHYWYVKSRPNHWDHRLVMEKSLSEFISYKFDSGEFGKESLEWLRVWIRNRDKENSIVVKYEDMINDTFVKMKETLEFLNINCNEVEIKSIVDRNSFKRKSGRKPGDEDTKSFLRRGISGEWKDVFNDRQKSIFASMGEDVVRALGYEQTI